MAVMSENTTFSAKLTFRLAGFSKTLESIRKERVKEPTKTEGSKKPKKKGSKTPKKK